MGLVKQELDRLLEENKYDMYEALQNILTEANDPIYTEGGALEIIKMTAQKALSKIHL